jgi:hypothetical protein
MSINAIIGIALICFALGTMSALVWWSRRVINRIDRVGPSSIRTLRRRLRGEDEGE